MSVRTLRLLRPLTEPGYTADAALNDIHTILTPPPRRPGR